jgi:UDP-N-acetylmuramate: L-alanyl-gamma-D-glutamyl-meso-diaminopimelate ligase
VLEPRSNSMRQGAHAAALAPALAAADHCYVLSRPDLGWDAAAALAALGSRLSVAPDVDTLKAQLVRDARPGDRLVLMSNGDFGGLHGRLLQALAAVSGD